MDSTRVSDLFLSDDFDTTGDLDGDNDSFIFDSRARKKPRLSKDQDILPSTELPTIRNTSQPGPLRRLNSVADLDPIKFSDPPVIGAKPANKTLDFLDSSLFASSSPAHRGNRRTEDAASKLVTNTLRDDDHQPQLARSPKRSAVWDPISSSAPQQGYDNGPTESPPRGLRRTVSDVIMLDDSSGDGTSVSEDEFPDITKVRTRRQNPNLIRGSMPKTKRAPKAPSGPKKSAEERAKEKEAREAEKERKKKEKEQEKQQRAVEKERAAALAEVNKVRTDKRLSSKEMLVHLPASLPHTTTLQAEALLKDLDVEYQSWTSPVDNVVKWSRKVKSIYNEELDHWEPVPLRVEPENHVIVVLHAAEFVKLVLKEDGTDVKAHVLGMRQHFRDHVLIYLIEGLTPWMRKNRTIRNRQFVSAVRSGLSEDTPSSCSSSSAGPPSSSQQLPAPSRRKKKPSSAAAAAAAAYVDEDAIEDALLDLQVLHGALIHHTSLSLETARQIAILTQHVSTAPYRRQREAANAASAAFCMETGQVRAGDGAGDTYVRLLQEVARVTAPVAHGIAAEFPSVPALVRGLGERGPLALEELRKSANKDGAFSDRRVGQALSKRLHKVFTGRDERSMDI